MIHRLLRLVERILGLAVRASARSMELVGSVVTRVWGWLALHLLAYLAIFLIAVRSFFTRRRMSHDNGIAARGKIFLVEDAPWPRNDFFRPGAEFDCRCRFSMVSFQDDARLVARGAALKFADARIESPLDLLMNTGETTPFNTVRTFWSFMLLTLRGRAEHAIQYMQEDPTLYVGSLDRLRRVPETFAQLYYHSKVPFAFEVDGGTRYYVRFRMIPWNEGPETGQPDEQDLLDWSWCRQGIRPGEQRSRNYLKQELRRRLERGPIRLHLQLQLHEIRPEERRREVIDSALTWPESTHPWLPLAEVRLDEVLDHVEGNETLFTVNSLPSCMRTLKPRDIDDPASTNYLRKLSIWCRRARLLGNRVFGVPRPFPDEREPGESPSTPPSDPLPIGAPKPLLLPQEESPAQAAARRQALQLTREDYPLEVPGDLPTHVARPPAREELDGGGRARIYEDVRSTISDLGLADIERFGGGRRTLATFDSYYPFHPPPAVRDRWRLDAEFARQRLNGANPTKIERCRELPPNFPVTDATVRGLLPKDTTLEGELQAGRLYICDYAILEGLDTADVCYQCAPICLFHQSPDGSLLPLAIQLGQSPLDGPIFTPEDPPWLWLAVRTYVQSADAAHHELHSHLLRTHLVAETIYVCARRQLSERHPLMELLAPHFQDTVAINHAVRTRLLVPRGPLAETMAGGLDGSLELLKRAFGEYRFDRFGLHEDLERRGVAERGEDGEFLLEGYHYRDDALALHEEIDQWVRRVLGEFYRSDDDVRDDHELQAWTAELNDPERGNLRGLPGDGRMNTREELQRLLSQVLFTATAAHGAVSNGQYEHLGHVPNVPRALHRPPPTTKDELSEEWLVAALPDARRCAIQIAMAHLSDRPSAWPLGNYAQGFFQGHRDVIRHTKQFRARLDRVSLAIRERNALLPVPYVYLDPRTVSKSILV